MAQTYHGNAEVRRYLDESVNKFDEYIAATDHGSPFVYCLILLRIFSQARDDEEIDGERKQEQLY